MKLIFASLLTLSTVFASSNLFAQFSYSQGTGTTEFIHPGFGKAMAAGMYSSRLNFIEISDESTISLTGNLALGYQTTLSSASGKSSSLALNLPLTIDVNIGQASLSNTSSRFGFLIGAGLSGSILYALNNSSKQVAYGFGPYANTGIRFKMLGQSYTLLFGYLDNVLRGEDDYAVVSFYYNFGEF